MMTMMMVVISVQNLETVDFSLSEKFASVSTSSPNVLDIYTSHVHASGTQR